VSYAVAGTPLGTVSLVVSSVPPPSPVGGAWWIRAPRAVGRAVIAAVAALAGS
jgi:hypothetical protein